MGEGGLYQNATPSPRTAFSLWLSDAERLFFAENAVDAYGDLPCGIRARLTALLVAGSYLYAAEKEEKCKEEFTNKAVFMLEKAASDMAREKELRLWDDECRAMVSFESSYLLLLLTPCIRGSAVACEVQRHLYTVLADAWTEATAGGTGAGVALPYLKAFAELISLDTEGRARNSRRYAAWFQALFEAASAFAKGRENDAEEARLSLLREVGSSLEPAREEDAEAMPPSPAFDLLSLLTALVYRPDDRSLTELLLRRARAYFSASGTPLFPVSEAVSHALSGVFSLISYLSGEEAAFPMTPVSFMPLSENGALRFALTGFLLSLADGAVPFSGLLPYVGAHKAEESGDSYLFGKHRTAAFLPHASGGIFLLGATGTPALVRLGLSPMLHGSQGELCMLSEKTAEMKGGFLSYGTWACYADRGSVLGESTYLSEHPALCTHFAVAVLPDDETVLALGSAVAKRPLLLNGRSPLLLQIDAADMRQGYYFGGERHTKKQLFKKGKQTISVGTHCLFSDALGIVSSQVMHLSSCGAEARTCDSILFGEAREAVHPISVAAGDEIATSAMAFAVGSIRRTYALEESFLTLDGLPSGIKSVSCVAANRKRYTLLFNLTREPFLWEGHTLLPNTAALLSWDR